MSLPYCLIVSGAPFACQVITPTCRPRTSSSGCRNAWRDTISPFLLQHAPYSLLPQNRSAQLVCFVLFSARSFCAGSASDAHRTLLTRRRGVPNCARRPWPLTPRLQGGSGGSWTAPAPRSDGLPGPPRCGARGGGVARITAGGGGRKRGGSDEDGASRGASPGPKRRRAAEGAPLRVGPAPPPPPY